MTICTTVLQLAWVPAQGIGQGAQPIISYNYGARNGGRVKQAFKAFLIMCFTYVFVFGMSIELFPQFFISLFNDNPELVEATTWSIRLYCSAMVFFGIQMAIQQTFIALGKAKASLFIACLRKVILLVPLIYILPNFFENKVFAVFLAEPVSDIIAAIVTTTVFLLSFNKILDKSGK
jgi:Na+-driven multidrug efflux pump